MMTNMTLMSMFVIMTSMSMNLKNPVKLSFLLLIMSMIAFLLMFLSTSCTWFPLLYTLIFSGGIMMMFMLISSVLPNEKPKKMKIMTLLYLLMMSYFFFWNNKMNYNMEIVKNCKSFLESNNSMIILMMIMILYFFMNITMCSMESTSLRKTSCWKNLIL